MLPLISRKIKFNIINNFTKEVDKKNYQLSTSKITKKKERKYWIPNFTYFVYRNLNAPGRYYYCNWSKNILEKQIEVKIVREKW